MNWTYNRLFSDTDRYGTGNLRGSLKGTYELTEYVGSTLASENGLNGSESVLEALAGTYEPDIDSSIVVDKVMSVLNRIVPDDKYKPHLLHIILTNSRGIPNLGKLMGCSESNITKKVRRIKAKLLETLNNLGYNRETLKEYLVD